MDLKVLIVDDDQSILHMLGTHLGDFDHVQAVLISDPTEAESRILQEQPDYILMDLKMGPPTGRDVIERLRVIGMKVPIVVMSGFITLSVKSDLTKLGIQQILNKPFDLNELNTALGLKKNGSKRPNC